MTSDIWYSAAGATLQLETWSYDAVGNTLTAQAPGGNYTMSYDADNRATVVNEPFGLTLTFAYDADSNRTIVADYLGGVQTI
jgi:YD repeat-containing protein